MKNPFFDPQDRVFQLSDIKGLYFSRWKKFARWALIGGCLAFAATALRVPQYELEATFKEGVERSGGDSALKDFFGGLGPNANQPQAFTLMKSSQVLRPLVEKLGLQIVWNPKKNGWVVWKAIKRLRDNLKAEKGIPLSDLDAFVFEDVLYDGQKTNFELRFSDSCHFSVIQQGKEIAQGALGSPVHFEGPSPFQWTLLQAPKNLKLTVPYSFTIQYWRTAVDSIRKQILIEADKANKSIYHLFIWNRDRYLGLRVINELMREYQAYLKREHNQLAKAQLSYLEKKKEQVYGDLEVLFDQHSSYLKSNLAKNGFIGLEQEKEALFKPYQQMHERLLTIELELARIDKVEKEERWGSLGETAFFSKRVELTQDKIEELKQQRDLLELTVCKNWEHPIERRRDELREVRSRRFAIEKLLQEVDRGEEISWVDLTPGIANWARGLADPEEREDFAEYLENYAHLLSVREKMLQERFFYSDPATFELEGIDLATARSLLIDYNRKLDQVQASINHYLDLKKQIPNREFELTSLSTVLDDPLSQKIIRDTSEMGILLKDEKHHTTKEEQRWEEEIQFQKKILGDHLEQLIKVEELNASLIQEKMSGLQKISLDCINQQLSVFQEQIKDEIKEQRFALHQEKGLLEKKMEELRRSAVDLPDKWRLEKWLALKTEVGNQVIGTLTQLVESKTISHHLHHVESKPLDIATLPLLACSPQLYFKSLLGAGAAFFAAFFIALVFQILKGFPLNLEKLKILRLPVLGSVSAFCDGPSTEIPSGPDLELLRQIALFSEGGKVISLVEGKGPDYSYALGENLARMAAKSIIVRCDFLSTYRKEDCPGLLQIWKREIGELPIRKGKGFDYITSGGYSPFGTEIIQSPAFLQLVELLKENYDWVFLLFRAPLSSAESLAALRICDRAVITVCGELTEELTPFINWGYDGEQCRLTFITRT